MTSRTVDWSALRAPGDPASSVGLRERKKLEMRRRLTDTATEMFLERGFDGVSVSEIAEVCGVSQKTVFNYFPSKEALILDQPDVAAATLRQRLADDPGDPLAAVLAVLENELDAVLAWVDAQPDRAAAIERFRRFGGLLRNTPALRAYRHDATDQLAAVVAGAVAGAAGLEPSDPEPQVLAAGLVALWAAQFRSLGRRLDAAVPSTGIRAAVRADVGRAAAVLEPGLRA